LEAPQELGYYFRRQHRIAGFVVDFYCHQARLCVEIDGEAHQTYQLESDRRRDAILQDLGILTLRFRNDEIALDWPTCAQKILFTCNSRDTGSDPDAE
jgi:very-short-patch-repair endonuclease